MKKLKKITLGKKITVSVILMQIIVILVLAVFVLGSTIQGTKEMAIK